MQTKANRKMGIGEILRKLFFLWLGDRRELVGKSVARPVARTRETYPKEYRRLIGYSPKSWSFPQREIKPIEEDALTASVLDHEICPKILLEPLEFAFSQEPVVEFRAASRRSRNLIGADRDLLLGDDLPGDGRHRRLGGDGAVANRCRNRCGLADRCSRLGRGLGRGFLSESHVKTPLSIHGGGFAGRVGRFLPQPCPAGI